jgi:hypothetical protein
MAFRPIEYLKEKFDNLKTPDGEDFSDLIDSCYNLSVSGLSGNFLFAINGSISANNLVFDKNGNSDEWNSTYTTVQANSSLWGSGTGTDTGVRALTSNWQNTFTTVQVNSSTTWNYQGSDIKDLTAGWVGGFSAYTTVQSNSASWAIDSTSDTGVRELTSNWESTYTTVQSNSSTWDYQGSDIKTLTGGFFGGNQAYTNLVANSAAYLSAVDLNFLSVSGNWNSVYSTVNSNSADWFGGNSAYTTVQAYSASWEESNEILPTVTNYLSTNNIQLSALIVDGGSLITTLYVEEGKVGINIETPNEALTVVGNISATGNIEGSLVFPLTSNPPSNTLNPVSWVNVTFSNQTYKMPLFL